MASVQVFKINGLKKEYLDNIKNYKFVNEKEEEFNVELKQYVSNYNVGEKDLINFKFTHESVTKIQIDERNFPNFNVESADIWVSFKHPKTYLFINPSSKLEFLLSEIKRIIQTQIPPEQIVELTTEELDFRKYFADIIPKDASEVLSSWWKNVNANDHSINVHGILRDDEGTESEFYSLVNEAARTQTSMKIMSIKLMNTITISKNKLSSQNKEVDGLALVDYFDKIIFPLLS